MARVDAKTASAVAAKLGLPRGPVEKALRLVDFLEECQRDDYLARRLVLKGGTALNVFYGDLARLSIDADMDYIGAIEKERMEKERERVVSRLEEVGTDLGFSPELASNAYAGVQIHLRYETTTGADDLVKVDLNFLNRVPVLGETAARTATVGLGETRTPVGCLTLNELAGLKLGTLCVRARPRDLFDVARFDRLDLDKEVVRKVALFRGFLEALDLGRFDPRRCDTISAKDLAREVNTLLPSAAAPSRDALLARAKPWVETLLPLTDGEQRFRDGLLGGSVNPSLLFGHITIHPRLAEHPALLRRLAVKKTGPRA
jgi:hypothetical protein